MSVHIKASSVLLWLLAIDGLLVVLHFSPLAPLVEHRLNLDAEVSIPTWYTQSLLLCGALLTTYIAYAHRSQQSARQITPWFALAAIFLYMSIDEGAALHEMLAAPVRQLLGITQGLWVFAWTIPAIAIVCIIALAFLKFFLRLPARTRQLFVLAAGLFVIGAIGMEMLSGLYWTSQNFVFDERYSVLNAIEETLENLGITVGIFALLDYLHHLPSKSLPRVDFRS